jgi:hypothetical protein
MLREIEDVIEMRRDTAEGESAVATTPTVEVGEKIDAMKTTETDEKSKEMEVAARL